jgi:hypothetical protein
MSDRSGSADRLQRVCAHCGVSLDSHRRDARYCDDSCRSAARHARTALRQEASKPLPQTAPPTQARQSRAHELPAADHAPVVTAAEDARSADLLARSADLLGEAA